MYFSDLKLSRAYNVRIFGEDGRIFSWCPGTPGDVPPEIYFAEVARYDATGAVIEIEIIL